MTDLQILAALRHVTQTAPDPNTAFVLRPGAEVVFGSGRAIVRRDGEATVAFVLGAPCCRFASIPLLLQGPNLRRPILWRTIPLAVLSAQIEELAG